MVWAPGMGLLGPKPEPVEAMVSTAPGKAWQGATDRPKSLIAKLSTLLHLIARELGILESRKPQPQMRILKELKTTGAHLQRIGVGCGEDRLSQLPK